MRILIMSDMEGVSGIVVWEQVNGGAALYEEGRRLYTEEINAAVRGCRAAGATEIVVVDCHGAGEFRSFNSLIPELLEPDCEFVAHHRWSRYTEILESGCDACLLIGMHARAGTPDGVLCHTVSSTQWRNLWFNEQLVGEIAINAALCGHYGCPIALVTGDEAACREACETLGEKIPTLAVKKGLSRFSARNVAPKRARQMIEDMARFALENLELAVKYLPAPPVTIKFELTTVDHLDQYKNRGPLEFPDPLTVVSRGKDWLEAWNNFWLK